MRGIGKTSGQDIAMQDLDISLCFRNSLRMEGMIRVHVQRLKEDQSERSGIYISKGRYIWFTKLDTGYPVTAVKKACGMKIIGSRFLYARLINFGKRKFAGACVETSDGIEFRQITIDKTVDLSAWSCITSLKSTRVTLSLFSPSCKIVPSKALQLS